MRCGSVPGTRRSFGNRITAIDVQYRYLIYRLSYHLQLINGMFALVNK